jgi:hypothetical protein
MQIQKQGIIILWDFLQLHRFNPKCFTFTVNNGRIKDKGIVVLQESDKDRRTFPKKIKDLKN